jgi:hypothetical protein
VTFAVFFSSSALMQKDHRDLSTFQSFVANAYLSFLYITGRLPLFNYPSLLEHDCRAVIRRYDTKCHLLLVSIASSY